MRGIWDFGCSISDLENVLSDDDWKSDLKNKTIPKSKFRIPK